MSKPIRRTKLFEKNFRKRIGNNPKLREQFIIRLELFVDGLRDAPIYDHALTGNMLGKRAFSVSGDIRVIYSEDSECYRFLDIGTHAQVYGL